MKYTEHRLSDAMLRKLSRISKGPADFHSGTGSALASRGLATGGPFDVYRTLSGMSVRVNQYDNLDGFESHWTWERSGRTPYRITKTGLEALAQARAEGW